MSTKGPTLKRILKEASELASQPSADYHAAPLESDLYEWHFTLRGPPAPSPFAGGLYHGRIILPPAYPLKPPSFRFVTPTGRFEVNREICLSISGHHEETWQPAWGIRTALVAIRSFMDTAAGGQVGGMEASESVRVRLAGQSLGWKCSACGKCNSEIMAEQEKVVQEMGGDEKAKVEEVPSELRLAYREDLGKKDEGHEGQKAEASKTQDTDVPAAPSTDNAPTPPQNMSTTPAPPAAAQVRAPELLQARGHAAGVDEDIPGWIDKAIFGVAAALVIMLFRLWLS